MRSLIRQKNSKVAVFKRQMSLFLSMALLFPFSVLFGQQVSTVVPSGVISVGYNSEQFAVSITSVAAIASGMKVSIVQPSGMNIDTTGYKVIINGVPSTSFTSLGKTVTIGSAIPAGSKVEVDYLAYSTCDIVTSLYNPSVPITLTDNITVTTGTGSVSATTNYYNVKFTDLLVQAASGAKSTRQVTLGQTFYRTIPITNGAGAGITNNVVFSITNNDNSVLSAPQGSVTTDTVSGTWVALSAPTLVGRTYSFTISSANFVSMGLGTTFDGSEKFYFKETDKVVVYKQYLRTDYQATWMANAVNCGIIRENSKGTLYLTQQAPPGSVASIKVLRTVQKPNMCHTQGFDTLRFVNNGGVVDIDVNPQVYTNGGITVVGATYKGMSLTVSNGIISLPDTDGTPGGFKNLTANGKFDDLAVGDTATIIVEIAYPSATSGSIPGSREEQIYVQYTNEKGESPNSRYFYLSDQDGTFAGTPSGPLDITPNGKGIFGITGYSVQDAYYQIADTCNRGSYYLTLEVPNGLTYDPTYPVTVAGIVENVSQTGNIITISGNPSNKVIFPIGKGNVAIQLKGSCSVSSGAASLVWTLFRQCNSCSVALGTDSFKTELHGCDTTLPACLAVAAPAFSANRITLGYDASTHTGLWHASDLVPANKISASKADLKQALVTDTVMFSVASTINVTCQPSSLSATFIYQGHTNLFVNQSAEFVMNGVSYPLSAPVVSVVDGYNHITYSIPQSLVGSFVNGAIAVNAKVIVPDSTMTLGSDYNVNYLKASLGISLDGVNYAIRSLGDQMKLHYPSTSAYGQWDYSLNLCGAERTIRFTNANKFSLPNEYRSIFHVKNAVFTMPAGYSIDTLLNVSYYNKNTGVNSTITGVTATVVGQQITMAGNFPLLENNSYININYTITPSNNAACAYGTIVANTYENDYRFSALNTITVSSVSYSTYVCAYGPSQTLNVEANQPGYSNSVTWRMYINNGWQQAPNTWLAFTDANSNIADITIRTVKINGVKVVNPLIKLSGTQWLINLGAIPVNKNNVIDVSATYSNCKNDHVDSIYVTGGSTCTNLTSVAGANVSLHGTLTLTDKAADMQAEAFEVFPKGVVSKSYDMCDTILYTVKVNSSSLGSMYKMGFWETLPSQLQMIGNGVHYRYGALQGDIPDSLIAKNDTTIGTLSRILDINNNGFPGLGDTIILSIPMKLKCNGSSSNPADVSDTLAFHLTGQTNCQANKAYKMPFAPKVKGFEYIDSVKILSAVGTDFTVRHGQSTMTVTIKNTSIAFVDSVYLQAIVPLGFTYVAGSTTPIAVEPTQTVTATGTILVWALPKGAYLKPGETLAINYKIEDATTCPPPTASIITSTYLLRSVGGACGESCMFKGTTDIDTNTVKVQALGTVSVIGGTSSVCQASTAASYSVTASSNITGFVWGVVPTTAGTVTGNTAAASLNLSADFSGTAKLWLLASTTGCQSTDSIWYPITVKALPSISTIVHPDSVCNGKTATFSITSNGTSFEWSLPASVGTITGTSTTVTATFLSSYSGNAAITVTATNNGCVSSESSAIVVNQCVPDCKVSAGDDITTCSGTPVRLTATPDTCLKGGSTRCTPEVISPYTCPTNPITGSQDFTVNAGQTASISTYSGNITMNGGTLIICGTNNTISNLTLNGNGSSNATVIVNGTITFTNININNASILFKNYGTMLCVNATSNAVIENYGTITFNGDFATKTSFLNQGTITAQQSFINNSGITLNNQGVLTVNGTLHNNSNATLLNSCTINANEYINDYVATNSGTITVSNSTLFNGNSIYNAAAGSILQTRTFANDGVITGDAAKCATIKITQSSTGHSSNISGIINVCGVTSLGVPNSNADSKVVFACSCASKTTAGLQYVWSPASGLSDAGSATPTITNPTTTTIYSVTVTDINGVVATDDVTVTVTPCSHVTISPNPYTQYINILATTTVTGNAMIYVSNSQGQLITQQGIQTNSTQAVWLNWLTTGTYTVQIVTSEYTESKTIIKE